MTINPDKALGALLPEAAWSWSAKDVILYHLGIGAGAQQPTDPAELAYVYEARLKVLPSFGVLPAFPTLPGLLAVEGLSFDLTQLLHGEHEVELTGALPTAAKVATSGRIANIYDKGKAAVVVLEATTTDAAGQTLCVNRFSVFLRGEGGFGGDPGPSTADATPDRAPDRVVECPTRSDQALLYRLSGDHNPLHVDPDMAKAAGFDRPILHGLCTFGVVCKAATDSMLDGDVGAIAGYRTRFAGVVFPGETIVTQFWSEDDRIHITATSKERGTPVLTNAVITRR